MRLLLLTAASAPYQQLARLTAPGKLEYCLRWGYDFYSQTLAEPVGFGDRWPPVLRTFNVYDWVMFTGADVLITNMSIQAAGFCQAGADLVIGEDANGINNDVVFMRSCPACVEFLDKVVNYGPGLLGKPCADDQAIMSSLLGGAVSSWRVPDPPVPLIPGLHAVVVPQKLLNAYPAYESHYGVPNAPGQWRRGDFVAHFPGLPIQERVRLVENILVDVVR